uniref:Rab-like protein 6 n=1 Tax=Panagrellus redivivus TaxID=6233 RepID=A0A7E4W976_PANRE
MLSALRRRLGPTNSSGTGSGDASPSKTPSGISPISAELQKKFGNGVNYNMKIVIRGDRNSGKTCLWKRIQGQPFCEAYTPTDEIQVASIVWNYRNSDHIVKLDVWDVVDESPKRKGKVVTGLKLNNLDVPEYETPACDAGFVDVYKNCHGVLLVYDITKPWTWLYVEKTLNEIPSHIPVLVMANKRDLEAERQVKDEEVLAFLNGFTRKPQPGKIAAQIRHTQASMRNAFGLKFLYNFLNIPFLFLQRETLESMLEANKRDIDVTYTELDAFDAQRTSAFEDYTSQGSSSASHMFSAGTRAAEIVAGSTEAAKTVENAETPQRRRKVSTSSEDNNKMVDMFEEDFDSDDEDVHLEVYSKKLHTIQPQIAPKPAPSPSPAATPIATEQPPPFPKPSESRERSTDLDDSWAEANATMQSIKLNSSSPSFNAASDDDEDEEAGSNPLVTPIPRDSSDDDDDDRHTVQSTEGSVNSTGFINVKKSTPSTLSPDTNAATKKKGKSSKSGKTVTTKKAKKSPKGQTTSSQLLAEDLASPVDSAQYESL